jgi:hypothetical protein
MTTNPFLNAEQIARYFHQEYESLAPLFGYETREASAVPWSQVPLANKMLMITVIENLHRRGII